MIDRNTPVQFNPTALPSDRHAFWLRSAGLVCAGTAFVALCAHVTLPLYFTPVPLTLQPFAVLVLGLLFGPRLAFGTLAAYLAEGAIGLPVLTPGTLGFAHLFGPTGGYLLAYPVAALLISFLWRQTARGFVSAIMSAAIGNLVILAAGAAWLVLLTHTSLSLLFSQAVAPFLPGDALKVVAAAALATAWRRSRVRNSSSKLTL